uniref:CCHC-type domain-containing protein n=1 Tax=Tanacetum cinerariifolium TaxID=118510 RepID=A0A699H3A3_TANCI|nr:hypothetical protein [Tanacetum cinerariifolium]
MTDYSLWEVILNGDSHAPTRVIECVLQPVAPTTAKQRLAKKNKLKARGTLLMALPDKHQLKFNTHKDAKTLMEAIKKGLERTGRNLGANDPTSMGFDMSKVECYNCHRKRHFAKECRSPKDTRRNEEEPTNYALMDSHLQVLLLLTMRYQSGYGYHVVPLPYTGTFMPPKPDLVFHNASNDVETIYTFFNVELSLTKPDQDLSPTHKPLAPILEDWISDSEDDSEAKIPQNFPNCNFYEKKMAQTTPRNHAQSGNYTHYARMTLPNPQRHVVPTAVLTQSRLVPITTTRQVTTAVPKTNATRPRHAKTVVTEPHSPPRRHVNHSPSPKASNFPPKVTTAKAPMVNVVKGVQGKWE